MDFQLITPHKFQITAFIGALVSPKEKYNVCTLKQLYILVKQSYSAFFLGIVINVRMMYSVMTQENLEKEILSAPIRSRTQHLLITSLDVLPLSYRRLVGAKVIKLG